MNAEKLEKLKRFQSDHGNPYVETVYDKTQSISDLRDAFAEGKQALTAGRMMTRRGHGKSCFFHIGDATGTIQGYARKDVMGDELFDLFMGLDLGDIIGIEGEMFMTRTGEPTIMIKSFKLLSKMLHDLPEKWHGLTDVETRFRKRYVDLLANREVAQLFATRSRIVSYIRSFFEREGFMEVETPMLHPIPGGAAGRPFITHHNALDIDIYMRIAPELYLKRLLVGGYDRVYEINRSFRNEGLSVKHNPEFTMLEAYATYCDYTLHMRMTEELIRSIARDVLNTDKLVFGDKEIDLSQPFKVLSLADTLKEEFGIAYDDSQDVFIDKMKDKLAIKGNLSRMQILNLIEDLIEEKFFGTSPIFVTDYYTWMSPLAKAKKDNQYIAERFELFVAGMEVANAYSELNDPIEQKERLLGKMKTEEELPKKLDEDFIEALEFGMPPAAGLGIGIDRLVMLLLNKTSIKEVILFPLLRPETDKTGDSPAG